MSDYQALADAIVAGGVITDPWIDGQPRFAAEPIVMSYGEAREVGDAARAVCELYQEAVQLCHDDPDLLDDFFGLSPAQKLMFLASRPLWHGIARADVFRTADGGLCIAELNCDTPTGEAEAVVLGALAQVAAPGLVDPNARLGARFVAMVERVVEAIVGAGARRSAALVYPTEFTEDLSLVRLYKGWLEERGWTVVLGSPYNLRAGEEDATLRVFDQPVSLLLRHYKTDWWSERASAWADEEPLDQLALYEPLSLALRAQAKGRTSVVNPLGAVLPQNKRTMAFFWEHIHRFTLRSQELIRELVPVTSRLEALHPEMLRAQRGDWVLKSDYGAEGEEVIVGRLVTDEEWGEACAHARRGRWIAQRYFDARLDDAGRATNLGVFLVAGEPAGLYARVQEGPTNVYALSTPVLLDPRL
jgi:glutathionylspermidine synthase